jgi:hypothetical protein
VLKAKMHGVVDRPLKVASKLRSAAEEVKSLIFHRFAVKAMKNTRCKTA